MCRSNTYKAFQNSFVLFFALFQGCIIGLMLSLRPVMILATVDVRWARQFVDSNIISFLSWKEVRKKLDGIFDIYGYILQ